MIGIAKKTKEYADKMILSEAGNNFIFPSLISVLNRRTGGREK